MKQYGGYQVVSFIFACEFYYATKYNKLKLNYRNKKFTKDIIINLLFINFIKSYIFKSNFNILQN